MIRLVMEEDNSVKLCTPKEILEVFAKANLSCNLRVFGSQLGLSTAHLDEIESLPYRQRMIQTLDRVADIRGLSWSLLASVLRKPALKEYAVALAIERHSSTNRSSSSSHSESVLLQSLSMFTSTTSPEASLTSNVDIISSQEQEMTIPNVVNMIAGVSNWQELGIFLGLDLADIDIISNYYEPKEYHQRLVEKWFSREPERSWEKLQRALDEVGARRGSQTSKFSLPSALASPTCTYVSESTDNDYESQIEEFERRFSDLQIAARRELGNREGVVELITNLLTALPILKEYRPVIKSIVRRKRKFRNVTEFFIYLKTYSWNFLEYYILKQLILNLCSAKLQEEMEEYARDIQGFTTRITITEFIKYRRYLAKHKVIPNSLRKLITKYNIDPNTYTLADLEKVRVKTTSHTRLTDFALQIYSVGAVFGGFASPSPIDIPLTTQELQVLDTVLTAHSDKNFNELKKKEVITLKVVEKSLTENGLKELAEGLEEYLREGVENLSHYEAYEQALQNDEKVMLRYLKFIFLGPPRSGKSSTRRRLIQEIVNLRSLNQPSVSTGVAETNDVVIKNVTSNPAMISGSDSIWSSLMKPNDDNPQTSETDFNYLAQLFCRIISANKTSQTDQPIGAHSGEALQLPSTDTSLPSEKMTDISKEATPRIHSAAKTNDMSMIRTPSPLCDDFETEITDAFEKLKKILISDSPEELLLLLKELIIINMIDIGGQPAFLEMLPTLTIGPALYFLFFRLDQELKRQYPVKYHAAGNEVEQMLESSYCNETVLYQSLSSITCFNCLTPAELIATDSSPEITSGAVLFGTFKDMVEDHHIEKVDKTLEMLLKTKFYDDNLLLRTKKGRMFFSVDNMNGDESEMSLIREDIEGIIKNLFPAISIPATWLVFRLILHLLHKPAVSLAQCELIADKLKMSTPVERVIRFFHQNVGSLMHYPQIASMQETVICDPQTVFDCVNELIIDTFKISNRAIPQKAVDDFYNNGQFSLAHIDTKTECRRSNGLSLTQLVDLLKHLNIIAEIKPEKQTQWSAQSPPKFVMPAVLKFAREEELKVWPSSACDHPCFLIISFKCGFVPFGVFCAVIAHLISCQDSLLPKWSYSKDQGMKRNKVNFIVDQAHLVTLISRPQYFEIHISQYKRARCKKSLSDICSMVRQTVEEILHAVISKMQYAPFTVIRTQISQNRHLFDFAFHCCLDESHSDHLMTVMNKDNEYYGECLKNKVSTKLNKEHLIWFNEDGHSEPTFQPDETLSDKKSNVSVDCLYIGDLDTVLNAVWEARARWYNIGLGLKISTGTLDAIESTHPYRPEDSFRDMLTKWLRSNSKPSWSILAEALKSSSVGFEELAERISSKSSLVGTRIERSHQNIEYLERIIDERYTAREKDSNQESNRDREGDQGRERGERSKSRITDRCRDGDQEGERRERNRMRYTYSDQGRERSHSRIRDRCRDGDQERERRERYRMRDRYSDQGRERRERSQSRMRYGFMYGDQERERSSSRRRDRYSDQGRERSQSRTRDRHRDGDQETERQDRSRMRDRDKDSRRHQRRDRRERSQLGMRDRYRDSDQVRERRDRSQSRVRYTDRDSDQRRERRERSQLRERDKHQRYHSQSRKRRSRDRNLDQDHGMHHRDHEKSHDKGKSRRESERFKERDRDGERCKGEGKEKREKEKQES